MSYIKAFALAVAVVLVPSSMMFGDLAAHRLIARLNMPHQ